MEYHAAKPIQQEFTAYQSMYLCTLPNSKLQIQPRKGSLAIGDIEGARPRFIERPKRLQNRQNFINRTYDIEKSSSKMLIPSSVNKPDFQLRTDDIVTKIKEGRFETTRHTNPLDPVYQLPVVYVPEPQVPKFMRDGMFIDDIDGVRTKESFAIRIERTGKTLQKEPLHNQKKKPMLIKTQNFMLDVTDINLKKDKEDHRHTNPLNPVYKVPGQLPNQLIEIGQIQKSKVPQKRQMSGVYFPLTTSDIQGAQSTLRHPEKNIPKKQLMEFAKTGSFRKGINSRRETNPLKPVYNYPGHTQAKFSSYNRPKSAAQRLDAFLC